MDQNRELINNGFDVFELKWKNIPELNDLKANITSAEGINSVYIDRIEQGLRVLEGNIPADKLALLKPDQSRTAPKVAETQAEWMYPKITEPFHTTDTMFMLSASNAVTSAYTQQCEDILNYHMNNSINKRLMIDQAAKQFYDKGVLIGKVQWDLEEIEETVTIANTKYDEYGNPFTVNENKTMTFLTVNKPDIILCKYNSVIIDPSCKGDLSKAKFIAHKYVTCKADLHKDSRYKNLDLIEFNDEASASEYVVGDSKEATQGQNSLDNMQFTDDARRLFYVTEYWGYLDIDNNGLLSPVVITYAGDVVIRAQVSPYPDGKLPFVSASYLVEEDSIYGKSNNNLLDIDQQIIGNLTRNLLDQISSTMDCREIYHPNLFKNPQEKKKYISGIPAESSGHINPAVGIWKDTNEKNVDTSLVQLIQMFNTNVQDNTGIMPMGQNAGNKFNSANAVTAYVDSSANRDATILGRFAEFWKQVGIKFLSMSLHFMEDEEIMAITGLSEVISFPPNFPLTIPAYKLETAIATDGSKRVKINQLIELLQLSSEIADKEVIGKIIARICVLSGEKSLGFDIMQIVNAPPPQPTQYELQMMSIELEKLRNQNLVLQATATDLFATSQLKTARISSEGAKTEYTYARADDLSDKVLARNDGRDLEETLFKDQAEIEKNAKLAKMLAEIDVQTDATKELNKKIIHNNTMDSTKRNTSL